MLEADINFDTQSLASADDIFGLSLLSSANGSRKGKLVTYDRFLGDYWPHFDQSITRCLRTLMMLNILAGIIFDISVHFRSGSGLQRNNWWVLTTLACTTKFTTCNGYRRDYGI